MKALWVAHQLLDVFKTRTHWPASEIMDTIKRAFGVIVKRDFAYKLSTMLTGFFMAVGKSITKS